MADRAPAGFDSRLWAAAQTLNEAARSASAGEAGNTAQIDDSLLSIDQGRILVEAVFDNVGEANLVAALQRQGIDPDTDDINIFSRVMASGETRIFVSGYLSGEEIIGLTNLTKGGADAISPLVVSGALMTTHVGAVDSQGDAAQQSDDARANFNVDGTGIKVGVISDSFGAESGANGPTDTTVAQDVASGDLPANVQVLLEGTAISADGDEGRAMAQIIHDVAPGADIAFHTANGGQAVFANGIAALATAGANIIVDDIIYFAEPIFQDGVIAQAVDAAVAGGVAYFSSAGNNGDDGFLDVYRDSGIDGSTNAVLSAITPGLLGNLHDWNPDPNVVSTYVEITPTSGNATLVFQWDEPFASAGGLGSTADFDIFVTRVSGGVETVLDVGFTNNINGNAVEIVTLNQGAGTYRVYVTQFTASTTTTDSLLAGVVFGTSGGFVESYNPVILSDIAGTTTTAAPQFGTATAYGHTNAAGTLSVGASAWFNTPEFNPGSPAARLNGFSSEGGLSIIFDAAGNRLATPDVRDNVDFVAPDGGNTTFFGNDSGADADSFPNFFGTSAAAPHAAAVAALLLEQNPNLTPLQIELLLETTADPMTQFSNGLIAPAEATGAGLINASAALAFLVGGNVIAQDDNLFTDSDTPFSGDLFADNGFGIDTGFNGDPISIITVNGSEATVGTQFTTPFGALFTINADGTFDYDPNGQFNFLNEGGIFIETLTYEITDGSQTQLANGFAANFELSSLLAANGGDGSSGFILNGIVSGDFSGRSVSAAGDVNGDGIDDIIIGANSANPNGQSSAGETYVVFGSASGFAPSLELSSLNGSNGFTLNGIDVSDLSGFSVSAAGDVNGDSIDDIIIGAFRADPNGQPDAGESYVVFGSASGFSASFDLSSLNGSNGFVLNGIGALDESGFSVSAAGDVNGDGIDDIVIGARRAGPNGVGQVGESYVVFGSASGFGANLNLASLNGTNGFVLNGINANDLSGSSVSAAGDVNGDGIDDIIIGARYAEESYVVFGSASGFTASLDLSSLNGSNGFTLNGIDVGDSSGRSVSAAGDVNGDGIGDIIIGAYRADPNGQSGAGESYVVFGSASGFGPSLDLSSLNGSNGFTLNGIDSDDRSGSSVSAAGDVNGDGIDDIIIGAAGADPNGQSGAGESYVVFGSASGFAASFDLSSLNGSNGFTLNGIDAGDQSGFSVSAAGDVNGDGTDDLIVSAVFADPNGLSSAGESYVIFGRANFAAVVDSATVTMTVMGVDDAPVAQDDNVSTDEDTPFSGDLFADNGFGVDFDPDLNGQISVATVDGIAASVGSQITLASGALLTVNLDGTFDYDPNGQFEALNDGDTATDSFIYEITDGSLTDSATVTVTINGANETGLIPLIGTPFNDTIIGTPANEFIDGLAGSDSLNGRQGNDSVEGRAGFDTVRGQDGDDTVHGGDDGDIVRGDNGHDLLFGDGGNDNIRGGIGNDTIEGGLGNDNMGGDAGNDLITDLDGNNRFKGDGGNDTIIAGDGRDTIRGGSGDDDVTAGGGDDLITTEDGDDIIDAGAGNDTVDSGTGADFISGGDGIDRLESGQGNDTVFGGLGDDSLLGKAGDDVLIAGEGNDRVTGGTGNDIIDGGAGDDFIRAGSGLDTISGGTGNDVLDGGNDNDTFIIEASSGFDRILGFDQRGDDVLNIVGLGRNFDTAQEVLDAASQTSADVLIDFGGGNTLTLVNSQLADLTLDDILIG